MANASLSTVISIRPTDNLFCFYSAVGHDKSSLNLTTKSYKSRLFDDGFFDELSGCLREYAAANPSYTGKAANITVLVPNHCVTTDCFNMPGVSRTKYANLLNVTCESRYANLKDLKINKFITAQNKQFTTVSISMIRQKLIQSIYTVCSTNNMFADVITFEGNASVNGAIALNNKLKNDSFVLLDVKESRSSISYVVKGTTLGCFDLPFGWSMLDSAKLVPENMLFDHSVAELAVLNAKEKAKAKALTMSGGDAAELAEQMVADMETNGEEVEESDEAFFDNPAMRARQLQQIKTLPKKMPRILPKWMQRPIPEDEDGILYENFRVFEKWVLEFIRCNSKLTAIAQPNTVYVNMPDRYSSVFAYLNSAENGNRVKFASLGIEREKEIITSNLELYGGLFSGIYNQKNNF